MDTTPIAGLASRREVQAERDSTRVVHPQRLGFNAHREKHEQMAARRHPRALETA